MRCWRKHRVTTFADRSYFSAFPDFKEVLITGDITMLTPASRRKAIRRTLEERAGGASDATMIAEAAVDTWSQIAERLAPVIGTKGVDVLLNRSLHLTSVAFPCLATVGNREDGVDQIAGLRARLAGCNPDITAEASYALLANFTELLTTLIGEPLTWRLLSPVWSSPSTASEQEPAQ